MKNPRLALSFVFALALCAAMAGPDPDVCAMDEAGRAFLDALEEDQRERCTFGFTDGERTAWTYLPGKRAGLITVQHILPNIANLLVVQGTIQFSLGILAEAGLSYVGLGTQPPEPSWGRMLFEAQTMMAIAPHMAIVPGAAIIVTVLGLNLLGDGLRDLLDPRLRRQR